MYPYLANASIHFLLAPTHWPVRPNWRPACCLKGMLSEHVQALCSGLMLWLCWLMIQSYALVVLADDLVLCFGVLADHLVLCFGCAG
eukprot:33128-Chlamydomonas_euryale.AAC.1